MPTTSVVAFSTRTLVHFAPLAKSTLTARKYGTVSTLIHLGWEVVNNLERSKKKNRETLREAPWKALRLVAEEVTRKEF